MNNPIYIIAGGPSLKNFDFSKLENKETLVINKAIFDVPNPKTFITMDYSFFNKIDKEKFKKINVDKVFIANIAPNYIELKNNEIIDTRTNIKYNLSIFDEIIWANNMENIGFKPEDFCSGKNSAFGAFQLALMLGYNPIYLLGYDFIIQDTTHYHEGYNQDKILFQKQLDEYFNFFIKSLEIIKTHCPNLKIYNCSKISKLYNILEYKEL